MFIGGITLVDPVTNQKIGAKVGVSGNQISISLEGYGEYGAEPGHGSPVVLDFFDGQVNCVVYADIGYEGPTHMIDLAGAKESALSQSPTTEAEPTMDEMLDRILLRLNYAQMRDWGSRWKTEWYQAGINKIFQVRADEINRLMREGFGNDR